MIQGSLRLPDKLIQLPPKIKQQKRSAASARLALITLDPALFRCAFSPQQLALLPRYLTHNEFVTDMLNPALFCGALDLQQLPSLTRISDSQRICDWLTGLHDPRRRGNRQNNRITQTYLTSKEFVTG